MATDISKLYSRLSRKFEQLRDKNECALICYVLAGYPNLTMCSRIVKALVRGGADIIEIGIPFSDPIADGPTIQEASNLVIRRGITVESALDLARVIRRDYSDLPLVAMTYSNIVIRMGIHKFMRKAKVAGIDGIILPDMPIEESDLYCKSASNLGLSTVFLVSPNTSEVRVRQISDISSGFLYLVSVFGITGARISFENYSIDALKRVKKIAGSKVPVGVGFGISKPAHVKLMSSGGADAVIVASAIIKKIANSSNNKDLMKEIHNYTRTLKTACKRSSG